jgi:hypothetical protein
VRTRPVSANDVRIPEPVAGEAIAVEKYRGRRTKAVLLHPSDFELFERLLELFDRAPSELRLGDTALALHKLGEAGQDEQELDYDSLRLALGE